MLKDNKPCPFLPFDVSLSNSCKFRKLIMAQIDQSLRMTNEDHTAIAPAYVTIHKNDELRKQGKLLWDMMKPVNKHKDMNT